MNLDGFLSRGPTNQLGGHMFSNWRQMRIRMVALVLISFVPGQCAVPTAAPCVPVVGTISELGCTHGIMLSCDKPPTGQYDSFEVVEKLPTAHDDLVFYFGEWGSDGIMRFLRTKGEKLGMRLGNYYVISAQQHGGAVANDCADSGGGYPLRACLVGDGVFFEIDYDKDGEFDDMTVKMDPYGTCSLRGN